MIILKQEQNFEKFERKRVNWGISFERLSTGETLFQTRLLWILFVIFRKHARKCTYYFRWDSTKYATKETFDALLAKKGRQALCLFLDVPEEEVVIRMRERGREDDTEVVIRKRIENYKKRNNSGSSCIRKEGSFVAINGNQL